MDTTIGTAQTSLVITSNTGTSQQIYYITRFVSNPLSGISSITAQTWSYSLAGNTSSTNSRFPCAASSGVFYICAYVWRPSTQTKVGNILDGNSATTGAYVSTGEKANTVNFTGSLVSSVSDGDVICFEVIFGCTPLISGTYTNTYYYDGTTVTASGTVSNHATYIDTPQTLTFAAAGGPVDCTVTGKSIYNKTTTHG